jgi:flagellar hook protein FlgE
MLITNINALNAHQTLMDINANNIANVNTQNFDSTSANIVDNLDISTSLTPGVNLTKELINQIPILYGFKAQIPAIETQDEMTKTLLDIKV